jgi:hypothetical protein
MNYRGKHKVWPQTASGSEDVQRIRNQIQIRKGILAKQTGEIHVLQNLYFQPTICTIGRIWHLGFSRLPEGHRACLLPLLYKSQHDKSERILQIKSRWFLFARQF